MSPHSLEHLNSTSAGGAVWGGGGGVSLLRKCVTSMLCLREQKANAMVSCLSLLPLVKDVSPPRPALSLRLLPVAMSTAMGPYPSVIITPNKPSVHCLDPGVSSQR